MVNELPRDEQGNVVLPDPEHVHRGQKERCLFCGRIFNSRRPYFIHFDEVHLNDDGTWRPAPNRAPRAPIKHDDKPWWVMHNDRTDPNFHVKP